MNEKEMVAPIKALTKIEELEYLYTPLYKRLNEIAQEMHVMRKRIQSMICGKNKDE